MVHFVSTQPGRETMNRVPRSCWQQLLSVFLFSCQRRHLWQRLMLCFCLCAPEPYVCLSVSVSLSLSSSHCVCVCSSESSPNPRPSAQRYSGVKVLFVTQQHASLLSCLLQRPFFFSRNPPDEHSVPQNLSSSIARAAYFIGLVVKRP